MRNYLLLVVLFLSSCEDKPLPKVDEEVQAKESIQTGESMEQLLGPVENFCQSRFVSSFEKLGLVHTPIARTYRFSMKVSDENSRTSSRQFPKNNETCKEFYKVVTPYIFSEQRGVLKNDLSLNFDIDSELIKDLEPGREIMVNPSKLELEYRHQQAYFGNEKNTNTVVRTGKVLGQIICPKPFVLSCDPSRKQKVCGPLKLTPPEDICQVSFPDITAKIANTQTLQGKFGGRLDFAASHSDKMAFMIIEEIESLTLVKDR